MNVTFTSWWIRKSLVPAAAGTNINPPAQARHDFCIVLIKKVKAWVWDANGAKEQAHAARGSLPGRLGSLQRPRNPRAALCKISTEMAWGKLAAHLSDGSGCRLRMVRRAPRTLSDRRAAANEVGKGGPTQKKALFRGSRQRGCPLALGGKAECVGTEHRRVAHVSRRPARKVAHADLHIKT